MDRHSEYRHMLTDTYRGHEIKRGEGRDDYGKEAAEAGEMTSPYCDDPEELREAWQAGKDGRPFVIQKAGEGE